MNVNIWDIYFELRIKYQTEERSSQLVRNLRSCEKKAWKKKGGGGGGANGTKITKDVW